MRPYVFKYQIKRGEEVLDLATIIPGHSRDEVTEKVLYWVNHFFPNTIVPPGWQFIHPGSMVWGLDDPPIVRKGL